MLDFSKKKKYHGWRSNLQWSGRHLDLEEKVSENAVSTWWGGGFGGAKNNMNKGDAKLTTSCKKKKNKVGSTCFICSDPVYMARQFHTLKGK